MSVQGATVLDRIGMGAPTRAAAAKPSHAATVTPPCGSQAQRATRGALILRLSAALGLPLWSLATKHGDGGSPVPPANSVSHWEQDQMSGCTPKPMSALLRSGAAASGGSKGVLGSCGVVLAKIRSPCASQSIRYSKSPMVSGVPVQFSRPHGRGMVDQAESCAGTVRMPSRCKR